MSGLVHGLIVLVVWLIKALATLLNKDHGDGGQQGQDKDDKKAVTALFVSNKVIEVALHD